MKRVFLFVLAVVMALTFAGCGNSVSQEEYDMLKKENESLQSKLDSFGSELAVTPTPKPTLEPTEAPTEAPQQMPEESFEPLVFSGNGDQIITDVNLPEGIFISTIEIDSTAHYSVKYHHDDTYELLVNNSGVPYKGTTLAKGSDIEPISDGILEIESEGNWSVSIKRLEGKSKRDIAGSGDFVTGFFSGTGKKEIVNIDIDSEAHYSVKLFIYDANNDYLNYDLLVNDSGEPYHGQKLADLQENCQYFWVIESEGNWSIN